jgi:hypothetical protein
MEEDALVQGRIPDVEPRRHGEREEAKADDHQAVACLATVGFTRRRLGLPAV